MVCVPLKNCGRTSAASAPTWDGGWGGVVVRLGGEAKDDFLEEGVAAQEEGVKARAESLRVY